MISPSRILLVTTLLAAPLAAHAMPVQWLVSGVLTEAAPRPGDTFEPQIAVGKPFQVLLGFDNEAPLTGSGDPSNPACRPPTLMNPCPAPGGGGFQYRHDYSSITMAVSFGSLGPFSFNMADPRNYGYFIVRDNYPAPGSLLNPPVDGLSFGLSDETDPNGDFVFLGFVFRGTNTGLLDIPAHGIPAAPPPGLADLEVAAFGITLYRYDTDDQGYINGQVTSVIAVPEPGTWVLMFAGLGWVGLIARRRQRG